jgi:predicted nucleic acid-binding Zn ribbon protein
MPIYEYRRPDGTTFELRQTFSEEALVVDPDTGVPVERVLHPPAVHFKGKGFYNTDYGTRNRQRENAAAGEKSSSADGSKADGSKADGASVSSSSSDGKSDKATKDSAGAKDSAAAKGAKPLPAKD